MGAEESFLNKPLRILLATNGIVLVASALMGPIYALFVEKVGGDLLDASLTGAAFSLAAGITTLFAGKYSDKVKENELVVVLGYVIIGIGFLLYALVDSILFLLIVQIIIGFGEALYSPSFDALYSKHLHNGKAGVQWGAWEAMNYFMIALGAILGGLIINFFGFTSAFIFMGCLCFISAAYIFCLPRKIL